ncbi:MAG: zinc-ribbon domain-containing protein [Mobilitalea sp.]
MAFFDKVGETISTKSKDVVKKAKDLAEISNLNGQINTQEEVVNKALIELGRTYYEEHKDIADDVHAAKMNKIKVALDRIQQLRTDINIIKGVTNCTTCGAEMASGSIFCSSCGAKVSTAVVVSVETTVNIEKICPQCRASVSDDALFCTSCGQKL